MTIIPLPTREKKTAEPSHPSANQCPLCLQYRPNWCVTAKRRFVPLADICSAANPHCYSITSPTRASRVGGISNPNAMAVSRMMAKANFAGSIRKVGSASSV